MRHSKSEANALIHESSPYLLQHAYNPIDWEPWGEAALQKAQKEDKLLIISIGYAACHWCHVMEHESFEDDTVAQLMNSHFVSIKVDREERPDVDDVYMTAANLLTGRGGWPLNVVALPDGRAIWAGTYFPKAQWMQVLRRFVELKEEDYPKLEDQATRVTKGIANSNIVQTQKSQTSFPKALIEELTDAFIKQIDKIEGGRRGAPKFPMPNNWEYLLRASSLMSKEQAQDALLVTLDKMANGGIYDQIGGGFSRYSVDAQWLVPHFEKMLYDNAQLVGLYARAYRYHPTSRYQQVVAQTVDFLERELRDSAGGFYASLDADSEGVEGKFYVWTDEDIAKIDTLTVADKALLKDYYNFTPGGNWEHGNNILHRQESDAKVAKRHNISEVELSKRIGHINTILLQERTERIRPGLDDKILTSWNALMISGLVEAYKTFGDTRYRDLAFATADFIFQNQVTTEGQVYRNYKNGKTTINGFLDDYATLIQACSGLYEISFDEKWLQRADQLMQYVITHFSHPENNLFYYTNDIDPPLIARKMELSDNVIPSSNSMMARNLWRLGNILDKEEYRDRAKAMMTNMAPQIFKTQQLAFYSNWGQLWLDMSYELYEVAVVGEEARALALAMMSHAEPNTLYLASDKESDLPLLAYKYIPDQTLIYVCKDKTCQYPVEEVKSALDQIKR